MLRSTVLVTAAILPLLASTGAFAQLPPGWTTTGRCFCVCYAANSLDGATYDKIGGSCLGYNGRTCNVQDPATGGVRSGTLRDCGDEIANSVTGQRAQTLAPSGQGAVQPQPRLQVIPGLGRLPRSQ